MFPMMITMIYLVKITWDSKDISKHKIQGDTYTCIRHWIDGGEKLPLQYTSVACGFL